MSADRSLHAQQESWDWQIIHGSKMALRIRSPTRTTDGMSPMGRPDGNQEGDQGLHLRKSNQRAFNVVQQVNALSFTLFRGA